MASQNTQDKINSISTNKVHQLVTLRHHLPPGHFPSHTILHRSSKALCSLATKCLYILLPLCISLFSSTSGLANSNPSFRPQLGCLILQDTSPEPCEEGLGTPPICSHSTLYLPTTAFFTLNSPVSPPPYCCLILDSR